MRDDLANLINGAAYSIYKRFRAFVEAEDLRQEMWAWVLAQDSGKVDEMEAIRLTEKLRDAGELYARKEKAARGGYSPDDEVFYGMGALRDLLPLAISTEVVVLRKDEDSSKRVGIPTSMEYETAVADLRKAYRRLSSKYRAVLKDYVTDPDLADEIAVTRGLRYMQRKLGGKKPRKGTL